MSYNVSAKNVLKATTDAFNPYKALTTSVFLSASEPSSGPAFVQVVSRSGQVR
eukprot:CAMPEP_0197829590 /NCGR_PEP_ID=MMETSP1437-20131217/6092_1 /TAXON_ID=49252 ORGANISM="Eucampia antarctica, Strain CCMP1452" /NCGR_SAMPLE_ID=MMETSP1437 /ASSEMBLY_ACC=CAM_ASM_001096 /LENGTH=52 /DNA_ID=CAMNT_0043431377 /DNA_START=70 /DNA_END=228 /DNA_ORIENTATION=-